MKKKVPLIISGTLLVSSVVLGIILVQKASQNKTQTSPTPTPQIRPISTEQEIRQPVVAGQFYPKEPEELGSELDNLLNKTEKIDVDGQLRILVVPHAGIAYSGHTAASGFKQLEGANYSRVILLGSSHKMPLDYVAIYANGPWKTPLGEVNIDKSGISYLTSDNQQIIKDGKPHETEHSLEVELIFLQKVLSDFKIIPILLGQPSDLLVENLAQKIAALFDDQTLLVVSTDLSHYPTRETANEVDKKTINAILSGKKDAFENTLKDLEAQNYPNVSTFACGYESLRVALKVTEFLSISNIKEIKYENSGDVTGDTERVVGYAAIGAWSKVLPSSKLDLEDQKEALEIARKTITEYLTKNRIPAINTQSETLLRPLGSFVTLKKNDQLRGCLGVFEPSEPLYKVIQDRAIAAATKDIRFIPVKAEELDNIIIEISVLTPMRKISGWREIELGKHGVVIQKGLNSGTFLPQVATDNNWSLEKFLSELCTQKVKLPPNCYQDPTVQLYTFEAQVFEE